MRLAVLALVLALLCDAEELLDGVEVNGGVADKLEEVARVTAEVFPGQDLVTRLPGLDTEVQGLVEEECLLVALRSKGVDLSVLAFFLGQKFGLALLKDALDDELVLKVLVGTTDADGGVLEDELRVALGG